MLRQSRLATTEEKAKNSKEQGSSKRVPTNGSDRDSKETTQLIPRRKLRINSAEDGGLLNAPHTFTRPNQPLPGVIEKLADFSKSIRQELEEDSMNGSFESVEKQQKPLNFAANNLLTVAPQVTGFRRRKSSLAIMETRDSKDMTQGTISDNKRDSEILVHGLTGYLQTFLKPMLHRIETKEIELPHEIKSKAPEDSIILSKVDDTLSHEELTISKTLQKTIKNTQPAIEVISQSSGTVDFENIPSIQLQKMLEDSIKDKAQLKNKMKRLDVRIQSLKRSLHYEDHLTVKRAAEPNQFVRAMGGERLIVREKSRTEEQVNLPNKHKKSPRIPLRANDIVQAEPKEINSVKIRPSSKRQYGSNNLTLNVSFFQDNSRSLSSSQAGGDRSRSFKVRSSTKPKSRTIKEAFVIE